MARTKIEKSFVDIKMQHTNKVLEGIQVDNECSKYWLKVFEQVREVVDGWIDISQVIKDKRVDTNSWPYVMLISMQESVADYVTAAKVLENNLLFESKFAGRKYEHDVAEGYIFQDM